MPTVSDLLGSLDRQSREWYLEIQAARDDVRQSSKTIRVLEPAADVVVTIEDVDGPGSAKVSLGFPFALASTNSTAIEQPASDQIAVEIHRTGVQIDALLVDVLDDAVRKSGRELAWRDTSSRTEFRSLASTVLGEARQLAVFADSFTFFGDAIQHRVEWEVFSSHVTARALVATTCIPSLRGLLGYDLQDVSTTLAGVDSSAAQGALLVIPCWVDSHWPGIVAVLMNALETHERSAVLVPGNNLIIRNDGRKVAVTHLAIPHYRLSDMPVEQSMPMALREFKQCAWPTSVSARRNASDPIVLAPFSSHLAKNLTASQLTPLVSRLQADGYQRIVLISGDPRNRRDVAHFEQLKACLEGVESVSPNLAEAIELVGDARIFVGADSSLAHAARRLNTPSVTIYNEPYWDGESALGLLHRSVVGFGTINPSHHHLVTSGNSHPLTSRQCEAVSWLAGYASGDSLLPPRIERACRHFTDLAREGNATQILDWHQRFLLQADGERASWLAADLPLQRLIKPFTLKRSDDMARWLSALTTTAKLGLVPTLG